jgi:hypothetical protein
MEQPVHLITGGERERGETRSQCPLGGHTPSSHIGLLGELEDGNHTDSQQRNRRLGVCRLPVTPILLEQGMMSLRLLCCMELKQSPAQAFFLKSPCSIWLWWSEVC